MTEHTPNYTMPRQPPAPDVLVLGAAKAMSYGPRAEPYDDGIVVPAKSAEDAEFWAVYPRKDDKARAVKAWTTATRKTSPDKILAGARRYATDPNRDDAYTKHATTWLNAEAWDNGPLPARRNGTPAAADQAQYHRPFPTMGAR